MVDSIKPTQSLQRCIQTFLSTTDEESVTEPQFTSEAKQKVLLASYPRSGNTLIRSYLEKITGIITGSDHVLDLKLNRDLFELGMTGEGHIDESVWIVKSHYPERIGHSPLKVNKCLLMVRSPIDCIWSFFNMMATQSHTQSIPEDKISLLNGFWELFVAEEVRTWKDFHEYWTKSPQNVPTYVIRYEDLLTQPYFTLVGIARFLLDIEGSIEGTWIEKRIKEVACQDKPEVYKPRSGKINASQKYFSEKQIVDIKETSYKYLKRFGYLQQPENPTGFITPQPDDKLDEDSQFWIKDFNNKMISNCVKLKQLFPEEEVLNKRVSVFINDRKEIPAFKEKKINGWRASRQIIKDIMGNNE